MDNRVADVRAWVEDNDPHLYRAFPFQLEELRDSGNGIPGSYAIKGLASVYNKWSLNLGGFRERVRPGAFTRVLGEDPHVLHTWDHDTSKSLSSTRSKQFPLELKSVDKKGLGFYSRVAPTTYAQDLRLLMEGDVINQSSFAFTVREAEWRFLEEEDMLERDIVEVDDLFDVTTCAMGAYPQTESEIAVRSLMRGAKRTAVREAKEREFELWRHETPRGSPPHTRVRVRSATVKQGGPMSASAIEDLKRQRDDLLGSLDMTADRIAALPANAPDEERDALDQVFAKDNDAVQRLTADIKKREEIARQRSELNPQDDDKPAERSARPRGSSSEPLTYEKHTLKESGVSFFKDLVLMERGDEEARQRLIRHQQEMRIELRDITTTAGAGGEFVPPLWLSDRWIPLLRAKRPVADSVQDFPLPPGTNSINLPKLSGGGATTIQASENAGVQETDPTTTSVSAQVCTIAGQIDLSRQLYEFSNPSMDEILFRDLSADYATKLDVQVISGSGSAGQARGIRNVAGINTVTFTATTPTVGLLWPKLTDAIQRITSAYVNPDTIAIHPRRAAFLLAATDTTGRPLFNAGAPQNAMGEVSGTVANGIAGGVQGMRVVIDPNIPTTVGAGTNEDVILVYDSTQLFLFEEGAPRTRVFEDVGSGTMTVRLSCYGFFAFLGTRYPAAISVITGTGNVPPTF
jgi:HK97 family phage major capsid protein/HK97 family phage prohead protease